MKLTNSIGRRKRDTNAACPCGQQDYENLWIVIEFVDHGRALLNWCAAIQAHKGELQFAHHALHHIQHAASLREKKNFMSLAVPDR